MIADKYSAIQSMVLDCVEQQANVDAAMSERIRFIDEHLTKHGWRWSIMHGEAGLEARIWKAARMQRPGRGEFHSKTGDDIFEALEGLAAEHCPV